MLPSLRRAKLGPEAGGRSLRKAGPECRGATVGPFGLHGTRRPPGRLRGAVFSQRGKSPASARQELGSAVLLCWPFGAFSQARHLLFSHLVNNPLPHHNFLGVCPLGLPVSYTRANKAAWPCEAATVQGSRLAPGSHIHSSPAFNLLLTPGVWSLWPQPPCGSSSTATPNRSLKLMRLWSGIRRGRCRGDSLRSPSYHGTEQSPGVGRPRFASSRNFLLAKLSVLLTQKLCTEPLGWLCGLCPARPDVP